MTNASGSGNEDCHPAEGHNLSADQLYDILNHVSDAVSVIDAQGKFVWANAAFCESLGIKWQDRVGQSVTCGVTDGILDMAIVYDALRTGEATSGIVRIKGGRERIVRCRPLRDKDGNIRCFVSTSTPLLELNRLWASLEEERKKSESYLKEIEKLRHKLLLGADSVFASAAMQSLLGDIRKVAPVDCTVLITGESGTGKEVVAKTIHANSLRNKAPFIAVCIPAIPENLLEAELFGYEQGAFTGAQKGGKIGLFEAAEGGTLFLDEIGDMPLSMQVKILRAIEYGEIRRVGGTANIRLNVRILAATNRDLPAMAAAGTFREDLFYRLSVVTMHVRPLRERPDAIPALVLQFLKTFSERYKTAKNIGKQALEKLERYPWPGNIRELRNAVERLVIMSDGKLVTERDVDDVLRKLPSMPLPQGVQAHPFQPESPQSPPAEEYAAFERSRILEALKQTGGNKSKAAQLLGMTRTRLYRKLDKL